MYSVVIVACADGENYISLIKSVQERGKTVKLFYYIEDPTNPGAGLYVRESHGHGSLQLVDTGKGVLGNRRL